MESIPSFNACLEQSIIDNWEKEALTDYKGATLLYRDVAREIEKLHIVFEHSGIRKGDKIAFCGRNCLHWGVAFLATLTYGAVAVPILHEFMPEQVHNIVNHSEAKLLFLGDGLGHSLSPEAMPQLEAIVNIQDFSLIVSRNERVTYAREHLNQLFGDKYPEHFSKEHVRYHKDMTEELAIINYTSGTTGKSKGVMLPYRAVWSNVDIAIKVIGPYVEPGTNMLSILPMAHMYGLAFEFLFPFCYGIHVFFLSRLPSPSLISQAFAEVQPSVVIAVPMIVEKIIRKRVFPKIHNRRMRLLLKMPVVNRKVKRMICEQLMNAFGGKCYEVIMGGAALNQEVEDFLRSIKFPFTVGFGTTECAPLVAYRDYRQFVLKSCGAPVARMEVRVVSPDPVNIPGEIITRGVNVMLGYYRNEEETKKVIDEDGWYHTGDLGLMDADGNIFIKGRSKNMLLSSNGQNVYPEEIEDKLDSMPLVSECIVVQKGEQFVALVYPDMEEVDNRNLTRDDLQTIMEQNRKELNTLIPAFCKISAIVLRDEEFEKTPKKSIKRFLYQEPLP
ncbi:MAG: AMP-binding protein [Bacteroidaceae bacterium]|nr:AMP-binding protein [Bacteroidaceae bacterium]